MSLRLKIIYTGGTLGMQEGRQGLVPASGLSGRFKATLDDSPKYKRQLENIKWSFVENSPLHDSANIAPADWEAIAAQCLGTKGFDGIVIIHGTDTLAYSASALAFFLQNTEVPVIVTGSQKPLGVTSSDALDNLVGAMQQAGRAKPGVWVYFHQHLMPGARVVKKDAISDSGFAAPRLTNPYVDNLPSERIGWQHTRRHWKSIRVATVYMLPGYDTRQLSALVNTRPDAIILSLFGLGTLADRNQTLLTTLDKAHQQGIVMIAVSQCFIGHIDFSVYATGAKLSRLGVLSGHDMTLEAAYTKLMVLLRLGYPVEQLKQLMVKNIANELSATEK